MQFTSIILNIIMKKLQTVIREKLKVNSKSKIHNETQLSKNEEDKIINELCKYFQVCGSYQDIDYKTRLDIVDKHFNKDIYKFIDSYDIWEDLSIWMGIEDEEKFRNYIEDNKEQLYQEIKNFVLT